MCNKIFAFLFIFLINPFQFFFSDHWSVKIHSIKIRPLLKWSCNLHARAHLHMTAAILIEWIFAILFFVLSFFPRCHFRKIGECALSSQFNKNARDKSKVTAEMFKQTKKSARH